MLLSNVVQQIETLLPKESQDRILLVAKILCSGPANDREGVATEEAIRRAVSRIQSLDEQLSAAATELDNLALTSPSEFDPSHIWTLIRTIKVQSQMLDLIYHPKEPALNLV